MEGSSVGSDGWPLEGGTVGVPKVGSNKAGPVMAETSGDATDGLMDQIRATPGV